MKLRRLRIERFRGIRSLDWRQIDDCSVLVGPGDSGKSTILEAIERVLSPRWNLTFEDTDFWNGDVSEPIKFTAYLTSPPEAFLSELKFGLCLMAYDEDSGDVASLQGDEEADRIALVVELEVGEALEPTWNVIGEGGAKRAISAGDREQLGMLRLRDYVDQHLGWARGSLLTKMTDRKATVSALLAKAARQAKGGLDTAELDDFSAAASQVQEAAAKLGVASKEGLRPHLDVGSLNAAAGALTLHDGEIPLRRSGLGTRRLMAVAVQQSVTEAGGLTLVDEFENGLEPYRIRQLLRALRSKVRAEASSQLMLTTHSPVVISEAPASEVAVVRMDANGSVTVAYAADAVRYINKKYPEALLSRRVLVAEGLTEYAFCRRLDEEWEEQDGESFAYAGTAVVDGGGSSKPATLCGHLRDLGYEVALFADSDKPAKLTRAKDSTLLLWEGKVCTEERIAQDLPDDGLVELLDLALEHRDANGRRILLAEAVGVERSELKDLEPREWLDRVDTARLRDAIGACAKAGKGKGGSWFKDEQGGTSLASLVLRHWSGLEGTLTRANLEALRAFVKVE